VSSLIDPRVLKGFRDFLPDQERERQGIEATLAKTFESYGFVPIDTPVLEYTEILLGKGGGETDKQVYRFSDHGGRDVALRFDLTVPFARFMAAHVQELYLPFKRYHIAKVWRGENTQRGRYREFMQCDFDIVGVDTPSADFEILQVMERSFRALGIERVTIRLSHRGIFNRFLAHIGSAGSSAEVLRIVDKLSKAGEESVRSMLEEVVSHEAAGEILAFIHPEPSYEATLEKIGRLAGGASEDTERLSLLRSYMQETGLAGRFLLDPSITRGLDYYTGIVYETFLDDLPDIGSVCSGGRYNNLATLYTKLELPGVGASIGLDRLTAALEELKIQRAEPAGTEVIVLCLDDSLVGHYHAIAARLREAGLSCEVYPQKRKLASQFTYAERKGIPIGVICGTEEHGRETVSLKDLRSRDSSEEVPLARAIDAIRAMRQRSDA